MRATITGFLATGAFFGASFFGTGFFFATVRGAFLAGFATRDAGFAGFTGFAAFLTTFFFAIDLSSFCAFKAQQSPNPDKAHRPTSGIPDLKTQ
ncbi:MAG: hypothetical protein H7Z17_21535 [Fuerstia sp.]|nr:hypothetical protein [Fuerstiella sp.]